jgi:hypothetical protein
MRITLGELRRIIREGLHDTNMAHTQPVQSSPQSVRTASHPSMASQDPVNSKANQVEKVIQGMGKNVDIRDLRKFISSLSPKRVLVLTTKDIATAFLKKTSN